MAYLYLFPENFQRLCSILAREQPALWQRVGYKFLHEPVEAIAIMNEELGVLTLPEQTIAECSEKWLAALQEKRNILVLNSADFGNKIIN